MPLKQTYRPYLLSFIPLSFSIILLTSCSSEKGSPLAPPPVDVTDYTVTPQTIPVVFDFVGFAESSHPVEIRARVGGYLDKIAYEEGQLATQNELLFQLDPKQFQAKVEEALGDVAKQEALLANAILTVNRLTPLYEQKAASKKDLDNAIASKLSYEAALQTAKAQLLNTQINLGYTTITSPITGYANKAKFREGALISPGPDGLLTTVSVIDPIWVYFTASDNGLLHTRKQEVAKTLTLPQAHQSITLPKDNQYQVEAILSDEAIFPQRGKVDFSSPTYDQSTGTLLVRAVFPNPEGLLLPGQFVRVKVYGAERPNALLVPRRAMMQKKGGMYVYLITKENKVIAQDVEGEDWFGDFQIITDGLKAEDGILVDGINKVRPGSAVKIVGPWKSLDKTAPQSSK